MSKETSQEIASVAGRILEMNRDAILFDLEEFITLARRLAGSCLSQYEQDPNED
jgi:hypothetical protein